MARTRATVFGGGGEAAVEAPVRGRGRARARGRARRVAPARRRAREASPEPTTDLRGNQIPSEHAASPLLQETLLRVLNVLENLGPSSNTGGTPGGSQTRGGTQTPDQHHVPLTHDPMEQPPVGTRVEIDPAPTMLVRSAPMATLTESEQRCYEMFRKMNPPQFQGGKTEDAHEFLTTCRELLDVVGLTESHGVRYVTLQLHGPAREWWRTYSGSLPVGSLALSWEMFSAAFYERFVPWSVREESRLRFESLRQDGLSIAEYETRFCQLSRHATAIIPNEIEKVRRFVRGLTYSIRQAVFGASRDGASFQSVVNAAKEVEMMEREEFGDLKRARASGQFSGTSSGGRGFHRGGGSSQHRGPVYASLSASMDGQAYRGHTRRDNYGSSSGFTGQSQSQNLCYGCGAPDHFLRQCPLSRGQGRPYPRSWVQTRPPAQPPYRGRGKAQTDRGGRFPGRGVGGPVVPQGGGKGTAQTVGGRGSHCYAFPGRPEAEASDAIITGYEPGSS